MHKPYDREQVTKILADIERYMKDLQELGISHRDDLDDRRNLYALSMLLFSIINRALDLADEVILTNRLGMPSSYREISVSSGGGGSSSATLPRRWRPSSFTGT